MPEVNVKWMIKLSTAFINNNVEQKIKLKVYLKHAACMLEHQVQ